MEYRVQGRFTQNPNMATYKLKQELDLSEITNSIKNEVQVEISANKQEITALKTDVATLNTKVIAFEQNDQKKRVDDLTLQISKMETEIRELKEV